MRNVETYNNILAVSIENSHAFLAGLLLLFKHHFKGYIIDIYVYIWNRFHSNLFIAMFHRLFPSLGKRFI